MKEDFEKLLEKLNEGNQVRVDELNKGTSELERRVVLTYKYNNTLSIIKQIENILEKHNST